MVKWMATTADLGQIRKEYRAKEERRGQTPASWPNPVKDDLLSLMQGELLTTLSRSHEALVFCAVRILPR